METRMQRIVADQNRFIRAYLFNRCAPCFYSKVKRKSDQRGIYRINAFIAGVHFSAVGG
jgi:hypothetical protein